MIHFKKILKGLVEHHIEFVVVGGVAAAAHGSAQATFDVDIAYQRTKENIRRMVVFLKSIKATPRNLPEGVHFILDEKSLSMGTNFTFETELGHLDTLGEISGIGPYEKIKEFSEPYDLYGYKVQILTIEGLIKAKRAASRPKDILHLNELLAIKEMKKKT